MDARYKRLAVSADEGNRWKEQLIPNGLVSPDRVKTNRTYQVLLWLTNEARLLLTPPRGQDPQASFMNTPKDAYRSSLKKKATRSRLKLFIPKEAAISILRPREAIETGKSDVVSNVKRDLLSLRGAEGDRSCDRPVGVRKIERQLAKSGLLLPGWVEVVQGDSTVLAPLK